MKKLCIFYLHLFLCVSQIVMTSSKGARLELEEEVTPVIAYRPEKATEPIRTRTQVRNRAVSFHLTPEQEDFAARSHSRSKARKSVARIPGVRRADVDEIRDSKKTQEGEEAEEQLREKTQQKAVKKSKTVTIARDVTNDQQGKIKNIKKGLTVLQDDKVVQDVFKQLDLHSDFQKIMENITGKADEEITEKDLKSAQDFLNKLVGKKSELQQIDLKTMNLFSDKLKNIIQQNFSELSSQELADFFGQLGTMTAQAVGSQGKKSVTQVSKKSISASSAHRHESEQQENRKNLGKGMMSSGKQSMLQIMLGMSFVAGIFVLLNTLANQN